MRVHTDAISSCEVGEGGAPADVDIVIPVYNEGDNIIATLESLRRFLKFRARILICHDRDDDSTLPRVDGYDAAPLQVMLVRNQGRGVLGAVRTGLGATSAACVIVMPADDDYNADRLNEMIRRARDGYDIVVASRFMAGGGRLVGCPLFKRIIVQAGDWFMLRIARVPTHDASNGFRLFSRRVIDHIHLESHVGFAYSIEFLVKAHRLGWPIAEVPVQWYQRKAGQSRFRMLRWLPQYLKWLVYAMATTYARRDASSVRLKRSLASSAIAHVAIDARTPEA